MCHPVLRRASAYNVVSCSRELQSERLQVVLCWSVLNDDPVVRRQRSLLADLRLFKRSVPALRVSRTISTRARMERVTPLKVTQELFKN